MFSVLRNAEALDYKFDYRFDVDVCMVCVLLLSIHCIYRVGQIKWHHFTLNCL